jgi:hypothetical protein
MSRFLSNNIAQGDIVPGDYASSNVARGDIVRGNFAMSRFLSNVARGILARGDIASSDIALEVEPTGGRWHDSQRSSWEAKPHSDVFYQKLATCNRLYP